MRNTNAALKSFFFIPLFVSILLLFSTGYAQHPNVLVGGNISANQPEEPSIVINRLNTDHILVGTNINNYYYSTDGGKNWTHGVLTSSYGVWGDPCVITDTTGNFYFFHLSNPAAGSWIDRIVCQKLDTLGGEWSDGTFTGLNGEKAQDKEWAAVDWQNNNIYTTWTQFDQYGSLNRNHYSNIMFSRSTDGAQTWSKAIRINEVSGDCRDNDNTVEGAVPAVGPGGEIYVSWAGPEGIVFNKSTDCGETWLPHDIFVTDNPGGWVIEIPGIYRCNGMPVTACDVSNGIYRGHIYINWADQRNGAHDTDIWLSKSTDGGETWSEPKRVNDDPPDKQQFFTWMTIDQSNGYIYTVFYDRRNYNDTNTDVYLAVSKDGAETFSNFKISESPFFAESDIFFGDYTNISVHNNVIRPVWARLDNSDLSIWTALINPDLLTTVKNTSVTAQPENFEIISIHPNPFNASTLIRYHLPKTGKVVLKVYDVLGQEITTIFSGIQIQGAHQIIWKAEKIANGIYFIHLEFGNALKTKRVVLSK